jgi:hypothetical protein
MQKHIQEAVKLFIAFETQNHILWRVESHKNTDKLAPPIVRKWYFIVSFSVTLRIRKNTKVQTTNFSQHSLRQSVFLTQKQLNCRNRLSKWKFEDTFPAGIYKSKNKFPSRKALARVGIAASEFGGLIRSGSTPVKVQIARWGKRNREIDGKKAVVEALGGEKVSIRYLTRRKAFTFATIKHLVWGTFLPVI